MISYKPSSGQKNGNGTQVAVREDGTFYGDSIGGLLLPFIFANVEHKNSISTELTDTSTWFYRQFTDYNFINGTNSYRAVYIGVDAKSLENEIIGVINTDVINSYITSVVGDKQIVDDSVTTKIWLEGKFNLAKGVIDKGGLLLDDEEDSTGILDLNAVWSDSINVNQTLIPGEYLKVWIQITSTEDDRVLGFDDYVYTIRVHGLSIPINKKRGRLNTSSVYSVNLDEPTLNQVDFNLRESIPSKFDISNIINVIQKDKNITLFYFDSNNELNVLTIKVELDISKNKYVNTNLFDLTGDIKTLELYTYSNFSKCITLGTSGIPSTGAGTTGTTGIGTTGTTGASGTPAVDELLDNKFIVNIFGSNKDMNIYYILFNEFVTENDLQYVIRYGHQQYNWNTGVIKVDLRNVNEPLFGSINEGDTFSMSSFERSSVFMMQERHFWNSAIFIDDLMVIAGFDVEDCKLTNNRTFLTYIWEKDIVLGTPKFQKNNIPMSDTNFLLTVNNKSHAESYLLMEFLDQIDLSDNSFERSVSEFKNGINFCKMGPPHKTAINHGFTEISYDVSLQVDEFSTTWSFGIDDTNNFVLSDTTGTTGTTGIGTTGTTGVGTTGTTGIGTTGTTGTTGTPITDPSEFSPYFIHMLYQQDYDDYISAPFPILDPFERDFKDTFISLFKMNCNNNEQNAVLTVDYNFNDNRWKITTESKDGTWIIDYIENGPMVSLDFDNVFTINSYRKQVYGCGKKYMTDINLYFNGESLFNGITYTDTTTDTYVITYNHKEEFTGHLSYMEVRNGLQEEGRNYAVTMYQILSNISWIELESENRNKSSQSGLEFYTFKRNILINNLNWDNTDDFVFPVVLQGNSYNVDSIYNSQIRRSVFDFGKIDVNGPSLAFAFEGTSNPLEWVSEEYNFNNDTMIVWVRLRDWKGQRLTMYYSDIRIIRDPLSNNVFEDFYGFWSMSQYIKEAQVRFDSANVYDGGEAIIVAENKNGIFTLEMDKQYFFGNAKIYKASSFDIVYDDREVHRDREDDIEDFIRDSVELFKPGTIGIRNVESLYPLKIEADGFDSEVIRNE